MGFFNSKLVAIPFKGEFREAMLSGRKTMTSRYKRYGEPGDYFKAFGKTFTIISVRKVQLSHVKDSFYYSEGFESPREFAKVWALLHPRRGFRPRDEVYLHSFRRGGPR